MPLEEFTIQEAIDSGRYRIRGGATRFARECCAFEPSEQQEEFFDLLTEMVGSKINCGLFDKGLTDIKPTERERSLSDKYGISIMSAKGTGKDAVIAIACKWFLTMIYSPKIFCTAPTKESLSQILWPEFSKWYNQTDEDGDYTFAFREWIEIEAETIYLKNVPNPKQENGVMKPRTAKINADSGKIQAALSGMHGEHMMVVFDEAAGVHDAVFEALTTTLTGLCNLAIIIFNPHRREGYAVSTHLDENISQNWELLHWSALDSNIVSKTSKERLLRENPIDSDLYRINVLGLPANSSDGTLIPYDWIYEAKLRDILVPLGTDTVIGVDPAGSGKDSTMCCIRHGSVVKKFIEVFATETLDIVKGVLEIAKEYNCKKICVDKIGVGKGVFDLLKRYHPEVYGITVHEKPKKNGFKIYRDELYWRMREAFEGGNIQIPNDPKFEREISGITYEGGKYIEVESKMSMKKRLGNSPDRLDSLLITFHLSDTMLEPLFKEEEDLCPFDEYYESLNNGCTWAGN